MSLLNDSIVRMNLSFIGGSGRNSEIDMTTYKIQNHFLVMRNVYRNWPRNTVMIYFQVMVQHRNYNQYLERALMLTEGLVDSECQTQSIINYF